MDLSSKTAKLLEKLVNRWTSWEVYENYYLEDLAPKLVANPSISRARWERELLHEIRAELGPENWQSLPELIREYRAEVRIQKEREREAKQHAAEKRQERARRVRRENKKQALLKALRECFEQGLRKDDDFYQNHCTNHISPEEYQTEKTNYLERVRQEQRAEAERQESEHQLERERQERADCENEKQALLKNLRECFEQDFLNADNFYRARCPAYISPEEYETEKINYVQYWAKDRLDPKPDPEQAAAIGAVEGHVQVVARAGSGKTTTLVSRALFLQEHCGVSPDEMLLLAFNRKAAGEMRNRLASYLQDSTPHAMTFHALAYAMVRPGEILFDEVDGEQHQSRAIQEVIDGYLRDRSCHNYYNKIRDLMMEYFRGDWERIVLGGYDLTPEKMLRYRRSLPRESLNGKYFKSFGEKVIADFLFEHDINYSYMRDYSSNDVNYRPDFTHFTGDDCGVVIECFGPEGSPDYDPMTDEKCSYWGIKPNWRLFGYFLHDLRRDGVEDVYASLKQQLEDCGIPCNRLSEAEIWNKIKDRAIDRFTEVTVGFIRRCRKLCLTPEQLSEKVSERVKNPDCNDVERNFLNLAQEFYKSYLKHLEATGQDDFDGLMQEAAKRVTTGETEFCYKSGTGDQKRTRIGDLERMRYVFIDEYQDFSELFYRLMQAVQKQNPNVHFFCVGDDWQAIYGFAGADLRFFKNFSQVFQDAHKLHVATNYRSAKAIVDIGNALMAERDTPARAHKSITGNTVIAELGTFEPTPREKEANPGDNFTPAVLRLVNKSIKEDKNVVLLSRKNSLPWYVNYNNQENPSIESGLDRFLELVRARFPDELAEKITISTVHKYKGLQSDVVIVLDAISGCYPLIHPDLIFTRIFGDSVETVVAEERRLFYVALTRAVEDLFILTDEGNFSPFLSDLERNGKLSRLEWTEYPAMQYITITVGNQAGYVRKGTYAIRELLNNEGYRWNSRSKTWHTARPTEGFSVEEFIDQAKWSDSADGIVVRFCDDLEQEIAKYHVDDGQWKCIFANIPEPPVLEEAKRNIALPKLEWTEYPKYIRIKVGNQAGYFGKGTHVIKESIKDAGYVWYDESKTWETVYSVEGFLERFTNHVTKWSNLADGIVVRFCDHLENEIAKYHVDGGEWRCISGNIDNIPELPHDDIPF